jgi:hypothetical protein
MRPLLSCRDIAVADALKFMIRSISYGSPFPLMIYFVINFLL